MFPVVELETGVVVIGNRWLLAPAGTVTLAGTLAAECVSLSRTSTPPAGAGPLKVTVPVALLHPATVAGVMVSEAKLTGPGA